MCCFREELRKQSPELVKPHAVSTFEMPADLLDLARALSFESKDDLMKWVAFRYDWMAEGVCVCACTPQTGYLLKLSQGERLKPRCVSH